MKQSEKESLTRNGAANTATERKNISIEQNELLKAAQKYRARNKLVRVLFNYI